MNLSVEQEDFQTSCEILGTTHVVITNPASEKQLINHIFAIVFSGVLIIPTILLNAIIVITILKSSQLKKKLCYFIILVQSVIDLTVGVLGIPLFLFILASRIGGVSNCFVVILATRLRLGPVGVSFITLSAMTLQRYIAILHSHAYTTWVTNKRLLKYVMSGAVVISSVIILSLAYEGLIRICAVTIIILIFVFTAFAYTRIYLVARNVAGVANKLRDAAAEENLTRKKLFLREIKQAKSCFIVVVCFCVLCLLPGVLAVLFLQSYNRLEFRTTIIWAMTVALTNSSVNSVIFFWSKTMLRKEAVKMLNTMGLCVKP